MIEDLTQQFIHNFGKTGPTVLFFYSLLLLWNKNTLFYYYLYGFFLNVILNFILKGLIKEPRPN